MQIKHQGGSLSFRKLTSLMVALLPNHDEATFSHAELPADGDASWDSSSRNYGDTRAVSQSAIMTWQHSYHGTALPCLYGGQHHSTFGSTCFVAFLPRCASALTVRAIMPSSTSVLQHCLPSCLP